MYMHRAFFIPQFGAFLLDKAYWALCPDFSFPWPLFLRYRGLSQSQPCRSFVHPFYFTFCVWHLGEGQHVPEGRGAQHLHHQAVEADAHATVRRRAVTERIQQEAKLLVCFFLRHTENLVRIRKGTEMRLSYLWNKEREIKRIKKQLLKTDAATTQEYLSQALALIN